MGSKGTVIAGYSTSGGIGTSLLSGPTAIYLDLNRTLYIYDSKNYRVQMWRFNEPVSTTVAGGFGSGTTLNKISAGYGLYVDDQQRIYVCEYANNRVTRWDNDTIGVIVSQIYRREQKNYLLKLYLGERKWHNR